jgi:hypothetical protein
MIICMKVSKTGKRGSTTTTVGIVPKIVDEAYYYFEP